MNFISGLKYSTNGARTTKNKAQSIIKYSNGHSKKIQKRSVHSSKSAFHP